MENQNQQNQQNPQKQTIQSKLPSSDTDTQKTRFDEWEGIVDCNSCTLYWNEQCDGTQNTPQGSTRLCKAYKATRRVDVPLQIKSLQNGLKSLVESDKRCRRMWAAQIIVDIGLIINLIVELIGG